VKHPRHLTSLGTWLHSQRKGRPLRDIALEWGLTIPTWSRLERGVGQPDIQTLILLHSHSGISYNDLMEMVERDYLFQFLLEDHPEDKQEVKGSAQ
jgi:transcriptional regulator with XRE-family HTH domain